MGNKICVYAICKQEAKEAAAWYENVRCADDVIVLDTGSTDGTPDILEELGCTVFRKEYDEFRFDVARNDSLDLAMEHSDANIFFTTDFDERMDPGWYEYVIEHWDPDVHTRGTYDDYFGDSPLPGSLNWMHDRTWKWKYPCHEVMEKRDGSGVHYHISKELDMRGGIVVLRHWQDYTKETRGQYLGLLRKRFSEYRDDESAAYLVRELMYKNSPGEALMYEPEMLQMDLIGNPGSWVLLCLAWAHEVQNDVNAAEGLLLRAYLMDPYNRTAPTKLAQLLSDSGNSELAAAVLQEAFRTAHTYSDRNLFVDNPDVWKWRMADWLGVCYARMGRWEEAIPWYEQAFAGTLEDSWERQHVKANLDYARKMIGG